MRFLLIAGAALLLGAPAAAQTRRVEVFGQIGYIRWSGDEGSPGSAASYGGAVMLPLTTRWAVDVDFLTSHQQVSDDGAGFERKSRRTMFTPALVSRFGTDRVYGFIGGGVGGQWDSSEFKLPPIVGIPQSGSNKDTAFIWLHGKGGVIAVIKGGLLFRADLGLSFPYVMPNASVRMGLGWRF